MSPAGREGEGREEDGSVDPEKKDPCPSSRDVKDAGSIPGSGRSLGVGNGSLFQYSCLENSMDREAWCATVHGSQRVRHN